VKQGKKARAVAPNPSQVALEVTWTLKGHLKNAQIGYLRVGALLARVRDEKMYAVLHHPDLVGYAAERLRLGRSSLYRYLEVHDWVAKFHAAWLQPKPAGFIPDLAQAADLIWIEKSLARTDLNAATRAGLEALLEKALDGSLQHAELKPYRQHHNGDAGLKSYLARLRLLRKRGSELANMPCEALADLDAAIEKIAAVLTRRRAGRAPAKMAKRHSGAKKYPRKSRAHKKV
jgi:hypothetical protein